MSEDTNEEMPSFDNMEDAAKYVAGKLEQYRAVATEAHNLGTEMTGAVVASAIVEYNAIAARLASLDLIVRDMDKNPTTEQVGTALVLHAMARGLAKRIAGAVEKEEDKAEYAAQHYEHKAMGLRWHVAMPRAAAVEERLHRVKNGTGG